MSKGIFFYQTQSGRHRFDANLAQTTNQACYAREMMERAMVAEEMLNKGASEEAAWKYYQTGSLEG